MYKSGSIVLKVASFFGILVLTSFLTVSCKKHHSGNKKTPVDTITTEKAPLGDTIQANLASNDKNSQELSDGSVMVVSNNIIQNLTNSREHSTFLTLIEKSGLYKTLGEKGPFTIFVPSNQAFEKIDRRTLKRIMSDTGKAECEKIIKFHIIGGILRLSDLTPGESINTIGGAPLVVIMDKGKTKIMDGNGNMADITQSNILCKNGVIHLVGQVLMPKGTE